MMSAFTEQKPAVAANPFTIALDSFTKDDYEYFNGRDVETSQLYEIVNSGSVALVFGESGVGKTSLVQCGLSNMFDESDWLDIWIRRGSDMVQSLRENLLRVLTNNSKQVLERHEEMSLPDLIKEVYLDHFKPVYLIFDQFEELYTLATPGERNAFYDVVEDIMERKSYCKLIFIIREEFHGKLQELEKRIPVLFSKGLKVSPMAAATAQQEVLMKYLETPGIETAPDRQTISRKIMDACFRNERTVYLPYLQVFLHTLWNKAKSRSGSEDMVRFDPELIAEVGEIDDVLRNYLVESIQETAGEDENLAWLFLQEFVTENTRRPVKLQDLSAWDVQKISGWCAQLQFKGILKQFLEKDQYELAHESLVPIILEKKPKNVRPRLQKPVIEGNPYKGLVSYDPEDCNRFFGRKRVVTELLKKMYDTRLVAVVGPSGAGKSSLIKAGVIPHLQKEGVHVISARPGSDPDHSLVYIRGQLKRNLNKDKFLVYIDQFEELSSRCEDLQQRMRFIHYLQDILHDTSGAPEINIILSIRSDYENEFDTYFTEWKQGKFNVPPFLEEELREVITEPAYYAGLEFKPPYLVNVIIGEVQQSNGSLPLLSYTLSEMYNAYKKRPEQDGYLTEHDYNMLGGVIDGIRKRANDIFYQYKEQDPHRRTIRNVMLRMVSLAIGERAGKKILENELVFESDEENQRVKRILEQFVDARLIITGKNEKGVTYYEPAHDSLIRTWNLISGWIDQYGKDILFLQRRLTIAVESYKADNTLWNDNARIGLLADIIRSDDNWLNRDETEFVRKSLEKKKELEEREINREKETNRLLHEKYVQQQRVKRISITALVVAVGLGILALVQLLEVQATGKKLNVSNDSLRVKSTELNTSLASVNREREKVIAEKQNVEKEKQRAEEYLAISEANKARAESEAEKARQAMTIAQQQEARSRELAVLNEQKRREAEEARAEAEENGRNLAREKEISDSLLAVSKELLKKYQGAQTSGQLFQLAKNNRYKNPALAYRAAERAHQLDSTNIDIANYFKSLQAAPAEYFESHVFRGAAAVIAPDGRSILVSESGQKFSLRTLQGDIISTITDAQDVKYSPDGRLVLVNYGRSFALRDLNGKMVFREGATGQIQFAAFSQSEKKLFIGTDNDVAIWSYMGDKIKTISEKFGRITDMVADGESLIIKANDIVHLYDLKTYREVTKDISVADKTAAVFLVPKPLGLIIFNKSILTILDGRGRQVFKDYIKLPGDYTLTNTSYSREGDVLLSFNPGYSRQLQQMQQQKQWSNSAATQLNYSVAYVLSADRKLRQVSDKYDATESVISPGGTSLINGTGDGITLARNNGTLLNTFGRGARYRSWNFNPVNEGMLLTVSQDNVVKLWVFGKATDLDRLQMLAAEKAFQDAGVE
ncbi:MAG TPA: hypothetical protein VFZ78_08485 [Flavisolibacter sp.]